MTANNKYERTIKDIHNGPPATVDVYSVLEAFDVRCPARQHAIKKLLCAGLRGKGSVVQDLTEARAAVERAVGLAFQRGDAPGAVADEHSAFCVTCKKPVTFVGHMGPEGVTCLECSARA